MFTQLKVVTTLNWSVSFITWTAYFKVYNVSRNLTLYITVTNWPFLLFDHRYWGFNVYAFDTWKTKTLEFHHDVKFGHLKLVKVAIHSVTSTSHTTSQSRPECLSTPEIQDSMRVNCNFIESIDSWSCLQMPLHGGMEISCLLNKY